MLFFNSDNIDNFIDKNLIYNLYTEKDKINNFLDLYKNKKNTLLNITNNLISITDQLDKSKVEIFLDTSKKLKSTIEIVNTIEDIISSLDKTLQITISLCENSMESNVDKIKDFLTIYCEKNELLTNKILEFEDIYTSVMNKIVELLTYTSEVLPNSNLDSELKIDENILDNNILIVSEKDQKAYLPYKYSDIQNILKNSNNKYHNLQDVINEKFIVPLNKFKNSAIARFREAFYLVKNKSNGSFLSALDLALELMMRYDLNPIIIAACRNIDELDIYLDCLEENELSQFDCFEIKFEVLPQISKRHNNTELKFS